MGASGQAKLAIFIVCAVVALVAFLPQLTAQNATGLRVDVAQSFPTT